MSDLQVWLLMASGASASLSFGLWRRSFSACCFAMNVTAFVVAALHIVLAEASK